MFDVFQIWPVSQDIDTVTESLPQNSPLLLLPLELQNEIYSYIYTPWSLAIFETTNQHALHRSFELVKVGQLSLAGPPGSNLLLTCRFIYNIVKHMFAQGFTGKLYVDHLNGLDETLENSFRAFPFVFRKWYWQVKSLSSICPHHGSFHFLESIRHFRNLRRFDCVLYSTSLCEHLENHESKDFISGCLDDRLKYESGGLVDELYGPMLRFRWPDLPQHRVGASNFVVNVKILAYTQRTNPERAAGAIIRWHGRQPEIVSRGTREGNRLTYWEQGMEETESKTLVVYEQAIPDALKWIHTPSEMVCNVFRLTYR